MALLKNRLQLSLFVVNSGVQYAAAGAEGIVYRQGAYCDDAYSLTTGISANVIVKDLGNVRNGDDLIVDGDVTRILNVTAVTYATRTLTVMPSFTGNLIEGSRLTPTNSQPVLYSDVEGETTVSSTVTLGAGGNSTRYSDGLAFDILWSSSDFATFMQADVQATPMSIYDVRRFGVVDNGTDQRLRLQHAIDVLSAQGGGTLHLPSTYYLDDPLIMRSRVVLRGVGRRHSGLRAMNGGVDLVTDDGVRVEQAGFRSLALIHAQGVHAGMLCNLPTEPEHCTFHDVSFIYGRQLLRAVDGAHIAIDCCEFIGDAASANTLSGVDFERTHGIVAHNHFRDIDRASNASIEVSQAAAVATLRGVRVIGNFFQDSCPRGILLTGDATYPIDGAVIVANVFEGQVTGIEGSQLTNPHFDNVFRNCTADMTLVTTTEAKGSFSQAGIAYPLLTGIAGAPTAAPVGNNALAYDTTNNRLYVYDLADAVWRYVGVA